MQTKLVTIITITKNDKVGVLSTVESTKSLRELGFVHQIVVDSSDTIISEEIINKLEPESNLDYYNIPPSGISAAFNYGIEKATTEWLWFLNGGDQLLNSENGSLMVEIVKKSSADIIIFKIAYGDQLMEREFPPMWLQWPPTTAWMPHPSMLLRRVLFDRYGLFNTNYKGVMDFDMWLKMTSHNVKVDLISIPLVKFDLNGFSSMQTKFVAKETVRSIHRNLLLILKTMVIRTKLIFVDYFKLLKKAFF